MLHYYQHLQSLRTFTFRKSKIQSEFSLFRANFWNCTFGKHFRALYGEWDNKSARIAPQELGLIGQSRFFYGYLYLRVIEAEDEDDLHSSDININLCIVHYFQFGKLARTPSSGGQSKQTDKQNKISNASNFLPNKNRRLSPRRLIATPTRRQASATHESPAPFFFPARVLPRPPSRLRSLQKSIVPFHSAPYCINAITVTSAGTLAIVIARISFFFFFFFFYRVSCRVNATLKISRFCTNEKNHLVFWLFMLSSVQSHIQLLCNSRLLSSAICPLFISVPSVDSELYIMQQTQVTS